MSEDKPIETLVISELKMYQTKTGSVVEYVVDTESHYYHEYETRIKSKEIRTFKGNSGVRKAAMFVNEILDKYVLVGDKDG